MKRKQPKEEAGTVKKILDRVTITGADDSVEPIKLVELSEEFPFVEWGLLMSRKNMGSPRFPSAHWLRDIEDVSMHIKLSAHLCGVVVRDLLLGSDIIWEDWEKAFKRAQLNFHGEKSPVDPDKFASALRAEKYRHLQWIMQLDGVHGEMHLYRLRRNHLDINVVGLYDTSGGAGMLPDQWPKFDAGQYHGYAGGLSPENVADQLELIAEASNGPCWIDVETHVRSDGLKTFDLGKVRDFLEAAKPWVI